MDVNENAVQMDTDADNDDRQSEVDEANHVGNEEGRKISEKERYNGKKKRVSVEFSICFSLGFCNNCYCVVIFSE